MILVAILLLQEVGKRVIVNHAQVANAKSVIVGGIADGGEPLGRHLTLLPLQFATEHGYLQKIPPAAERMRRLRGRFADSEAAHAPMALGVAVSADAAAAAAAPHP